MKGFPVGAVIGGVVGAAGGAVVGAQINSWTGTLIGAYGGLAIGAFLGTGLVGFLVRSGDPDKRRAALVELWSGCGATFGAAVGYAVGMIGIPRFSPGFGFFVGLALGGALTGLLVMLRLDVKQPPLGATAFLSVSLAGGGAALGTLDGHPLAVAAGLVGGSLIGAVLTLLVVRGLKHGVDWYLSGQRDDDWPCGQ